MKHRHHARINHQGVREQVAVTTWQAMAQLARANKPWPTALLLWPSWWALWLANPTRPVLANYLIFFIGALLMRAAGCVINDYMDRDLDRQVKRTCKRPLAAKTLSTKQALSLFITLLTLSAGLLVFLNQSCLILAVLAVALVMIYPCTKRWISCPQLVLGVVFAWGVPMGFAANDQLTNPLAVLLFCSTACWIIGFDTIYALQDFADDLHLPIGSSAVAWNGYVDQAVTYCYATFLLGMAMVGYAAALAWFYSLAWLVAVYLLRRQVISLGGDEVDYYHVFRDNHHIGWVFAVGMVLDSYYSGG